LIIFLIVYYTGVEETGKNPGIFKGNRAKKLESVVNRTEFPFETYNPEADSPRSR
jgi:hypothetical protein